VLAATWITGLVHQFGSWSMTTVYVAISLMMVAVTFGNRLVLNSHLGETADGNARALHSELVVPIRQLANAATAFTQQTK
jgi:hypothetical protein